MKNVRRATCDVRRAACDVQRGSSHVIGRILMTAIAVAIAGSTRVFACPMCFGAEETAMVDATKLGIFVMLGITVAVQGGFVGFFVYLRKHAKRHAEHELDAEWSDLQKPPRT
jgi:hypothetical protein